MLVIVTPVNILGLPSVITFNDTESDDEDFKKPKKPKKKGHKITFSDDDDDFSLSPKPSSSKDSNESLGKIYSTFTSIRISILNCQFEISCVFDFETEKPT